MPVVQRWFDGIGSNYGIPHLMISAATELNLGLISLLLVLIIGSISRVVEILQPFAKPTVLLDYSLEVR
jgi:hypothetical protein